MSYEFTKFTTTAATTLADSIDTANERALEVVVDTTRRVVDFAVTTADRLADQITFELPFADRLPTPAETGERYLEFVERAVAVNREFNDRIVAMLKADVPAAAEKFATTVTEVADKPTETVTEAAASVKASPKPATSRTATARTAQTRKAAAKRTAAKATTAKRAAKKTAAKKSTAAR